MGSEFTDRTEAEDQASPRTAAVRAAVATDTGTRYRANFDAAHLRTDPLLAVVADGMGDSDGSAFAGRTTISLITRGAEDGIDGLSAAVAEAHEAAAAFAGHNTVLTGCTLTALAECPDGFWVVQLGDSRLYRLRRGLLELLTVDHTMAWLGAVHGWYPFDSTEAHRARYHLTRYIGHYDRPAPDLLKLDVSPGDVLMLCTDGIAEQVSYQRIQEILGSVHGPQHMVSALVAEAAAAGGNDNATAIVVHVDRPGTTASA